MLFLPFQEEPLNEIMMGIMKGNGEVLIITKVVR